MTWSLLLVAFTALCAFAVVISVIVILFRAVAKSSQGPRSDPGAAGIAPVITDDSLTNPTHPLYPLHHPAPFPDDPSRHQAVDPSPSPSSFDAGNLPASSDSGGSGCG